MGAAGPGDEGVERGTEGQPGGASCTYAGRPRPSLDTLPSLAPISRRTRAPHPAILCLAMTGALGLLLEIGAAVMVSPLVGQGQRLVWQRLPDDQVE